MWSFFFGKKAEETYETLYVPVNYKVSEFKKFPHYHSQNEYLLSQLPAQVAGCSQKEILASDLSGKMDLSNPDSAKAILALTVPKANLKDAKQVSDWGDIKVQSIDRSKLTKNNVTSVTLISLDAKNAIQVTLKDINKPKGGGGPAPRC